MKSTRKRSLRKKSVRKVVSKRTRRTQRKRASSRKRAQRTRRTPRKRASSRKRTLKKKTRRSLRGGGIVDTIKEKYRGYQEKKAAQKAEKKAQIAKTIEDNPHMYKPFSMGRAVLSTLYYSYATVENKKYMTAFEVADEIVERILKGDNTLDIPVELKKKILPMDPDKATKSIQTEVANVLSGFRKNGILDFRKTSSYDNMYSISDRRFEMEDVFYNY